MSRNDSRNALGIRTETPFAGEDVWTAFEFSWLNSRGKPEVALVRIRVPAHSPAIVESKSMKLYLGSFAQTRIENVAKVLAMLRDDLGSAFGTEVAVDLLSMADITVPTSPPGICLDDLEIDIEHYDYAPEALAVLPDAGMVMGETLHTNVFRSLCPVTGQPDSATIIVRYSGPSLDRAALLRYLVGFRRRSAFHEAVVEQIFMDLSAQCRTEALTVQGCFLRRGGIDISPFRSDFEAPGAALRLLRQ